MVKPATKLFLDKHLENRKKKITDVYIDANDLKAITPKERKRAGDNASRLINRPSSKIYIKEHIELAKQTTVEVLETARRQKDDVKWQKLASDQAERILDRELGKPTQTSVNQSTNINVNVEANPQLGKQFMEFMKQSTQQT